MRDIIEILKSESRFVVTSHCSPDGDNIGSTMAMIKALVKEGKEAYWALEDSVPKSLHFLYQGVLQNQEFGNDEYVLIGLDCGDKARLCCSEEIVKNAKYVINIDHHISNPSYGDYNYLDFEASSTCELVYRIIKELNDELLNEKEISEAIYAGIMTDTGNFMYSNTSPETFVVSGDLLSRGIDRQKIIENLYQNNPKGYPRFLSKVLDTLHIHEEKIAVAYFTQEMLEESNVDYNDTEDVVNYTRDIEGVELGILLKEKEKGLIKVSLRSKKILDVNILASQFGGGGHKRAAGCTIKEELPRALEMLLNAAKKALRG